MLPNTYAIHLCDIFFPDIGQCFQPEIKTVYAIENSTKLGIF